MAKVEMKRFNLTIPVSLHEELKQAVETHSMVTVTSLLRSYINLGLRFTRGKIAIYHIEEDGTEIPARVII